jgi:hypothetical protein
VKGDLVETIFFDRLTDPFQLKNIAGTDKEVEDHLLNLTGDWMIRARDPLSLKITQKVGK